MVTEAKIMTHLAEALSGTAKRLENEERDFIESMARVHRIQREKTREKMADSKPTMAYLAELLTDLAKLLERDDLKALVETDEGLHFTFEGLLTQILSLNIKLEERLEGRTLAECEAEDRPSVA